MSDIAITNYGVRMKMFIPCMGNVCADDGGKMQLIDYDNPHTFPKYRCTRESCLFHTLPYDAREITRWHTDPDAPKRKAGEREAPTAQEWETSI